MRHQTNNGTDHYRRSRGAAGVARDEVNARLSDSHTVFVGIGDVAGYVRTRIQEAKEAIGTGGAIFVVSPSIQT